MTTPKPRSYWKLFAAPYFLGFVATYYFLASADITTPVPPQRPEFRDQVAFQLAFSVWLPIFVASLLVDFCIRCYRGARPQVLQSPFFVPLAPGLACAIAWWLYTDHWYGVYDSWNGVVNTHAKPVWWLVAESGVVGFLGFTFTTLIYICFVPVARVTLIQRLDQISERITTFMGQKA